MKYAIAEENLGFFLGAFQKYGIFAKTDVFGLSKAVAFASEKEALNYIDEYLGKSRGDWKIIGIHTDGEYIDVVDLLKNGHEKYTHKMIDSLPMVSTQVH